MASAVGKCAARWLMAPVSKLGVRRKATQVAAEEVPAYMGAASQAIFQRESRYGAHNYHPLPVALNKGKGYNNYVNRQISALIESLIKHTQLIIIIFFLYS